MTEQTQPARGIKFCPTCGGDMFRPFPTSFDRGSYCFEYAGGTCSQACAITFVIVEMGRELLKLLRAMAYPVYYSTPKGGVTPIPPSHLEAMKHGMGGGATWDEGQGRYVPVEEAEPAPHPTDQEPSPPATPKPSWWDEADY